MKESFLSLALEAWRLSRVFLDLIDKVDLEQKKQFQRKLLWFEDRFESILEETDYRLVNLEGQNFVVGMAVKAINLDDFDDNENLVISRMLEPIIMGQNGVEKLGTVLLRSSES